MSNFLAKVASKIFETHKDELSKVLVVFPSRRAGLYFRKELSALIEKPVWSPTIMSINEFISSFSNLEIADKIILIIELYKTYKKHISGESFDDFYTWGEMLLKDFDDIDRYLVKADHLFKKLRDEKEIENLFQTEINEEAKNFWGSLVKIKSGNEYSKNFLQVWNSIFDIYSDYKISLLSKGIAYEGLAVREIAENINLSSSFENYTAIYFAGFNSLNKCECEIIKSLIEKGKATIYWDADSYYVNDFKQEAGFFIRKFHKLLGGEIIKSDGSLSKDNKKIEVIGSPLNIGMIKSLGIKLKEEFENRKVLPEKTLVVIPDSSGLIPVLYALPEKPEKINVTMGLPLKSTPLFNLISIIYKLHTGKIYENNILKFYYKDVINLLMHPYIKFTSAKDIFNFIRNVREENIVYVDIHGQFINTLENKSTKILLALIFKVSSDVNEIIKNLNNIINSLAISMETSNDPDEEYKLFQLEYLYNISTQLNILTDAIKIDGFELNQFTFWNMLIQMLNTSNVLLTGEPLQGLQVMGLLETRNLSFENVFILYMNEGSMPPGSQANSYIPYSLRKGFGMPTYEEIDSINAYYFWSLIHKANNVYLFYNTETGNEVKEKSRYILQIEKELLQVNKNIRYNHLIVSPSVKDININKIDIIKTYELNEFIFERVKRLSPTYISDYINCGLQFYLKKVIGLKVNESVEEIFTPSTLGSVFHGVMQKIYEPYIDKIITPEILDNIINDINTDFDTFFDSYIKSEKRFSNFNFDEKGRNSIYKSVIRKLVIKILEKEKDREPFIIKALEKKLYSKMMISVNGKEQEIVIGGIIDRIDEQNGVTIVIDYKTGAAELKKLSEKNYEKYWTELQISNKYNSSFQTMFYAYLLWLEKPEKKYNAGLYNVKNLKDGIITICDVPFESNDLKRFESVMKLILEDIFNTEKYFSQTENPEDCIFCDYKQLCNR